EQGSSMNVYMDTFSKELEVESATQTEYTEEQSGSSVIVIERTEKMECEINNKQSVEFADPDGHEDMEASTGNVEASYVGIETIKDETECVFSEVDPRYKTVMVIGEDGVAQPFDVLTIEKPNIKTQKASGRHRDQMKSIDVSDMIISSIHQQNVCKVLLSDPKGATSKQLECKDERVLNEAEDPKSLEKRLGKSPVSDEDSKILNKTVQKPEVGNTEPSSGTLQEVTPEHSDSSCNTHQDSSNDPPATKTSQTKTHKESKVCFICKKCLPKSYSMKVHMRSHSDIRPHTCPHCGQMFKNLYDMRKHIVKTEHAVVLSPFHCTECSRVFTDPEKLDRHKLVHKPLKCSMCETALIRHERIHTGDLPYQCSYCPRKFNISAVLVEHERIHTGEKRCLCWECGKGFITLLEIHASYKHCDATILMIILVGFF
uniref:C2H2-type domain-containing protein n=1 Tax=Esox lucius TaxID=8010 RepID=A0AAY5L139_ESOLU